MSDKPDNGGSSASSRSAGTDRRQIFVNTLAGYVSKVSDLLVALLLIPFMVNYLGDPDYGLWILIGSVVAYGSLLDFGIASAVTKYVSEYQVLNQSDKARQLIASALWVYTSIGLFIVILFAVIAPWLPGWFELEQSQYQTAKWLVILTGSGIGLSIPFGASMAVLKGLHRFDITSWLGMARFMLFALGVLVVLLNGGGVLHIAAVQIAAMCLVQIPAIIWIYRLAPELRFGFSGADLSGVKTLSSFSWALFCVSIGGQLQSKTDEIVIGSRLPVGVVTPYSLAHKLSQIPQMLAEQFVKLILPIASELQAQNDREAIKTTLTVSTRLTVSVFMSVGVLIGLLAAPILKLWVGPSYAEYSALVSVLVAAVFFDTIQWPAAMILQGMNRHRLFAVTSILTGVANIGLSIALIPRFGLMGVALGTLIPAAIEFAFVILPYAIHVIRISPVRLLKEAFLPAILPAVPTTLLLLVTYDYIDSRGVPGLLLAAAITMLLYAGIYLANPASSAERKIIAGWRS